MQRLTFLSGDLCHSVALPPLTVKVDPMVGRPIRTLIVEPLESVVPEPEPALAPTLEVSA